MQTCGDAHSKESPIANFTNDSPSQRIGSSVFGVKAGSCLIVVALSISVVACNRQQIARRLDFNQDVQPILAGVYKIDGAGNASPDMRVGCRRFLVCPNQIGSALAWRVAL